MSEPSHNDIYLKLGRFEGDIDAVMKGISDLKETMKDGFEQVNTRLTALEAKENERHGAWKVTAAVAAFIGAIASAIGNYLLGRL